MEDWQENVIDRGYARNSKEWAFLLNHNWTNLLRIMEAQLKQEELKAAVRAREGGDNKTVWTHLQLTWDRLPDRPWIHQIPGFGVLCDLCSDFHG